MARVGTAGEVAWIEQKGGGVAGGVKYQDVTADFEMFNRHLCNAEGGWRPAATLICREALHVVICPFCQR